MVKSNAVSMLAAGRLIVRRFARGSLPREGSLCEDLREAVCHELRFRKKDCTRRIA